MNKQEKIEGRKFFSSVSPRYSNRVSTEVTFWHSAEYGSDFRLNSGEIPRGIPCRRNSVDTLSSNVLQILKNTMELEQLTNKNQEFTQRTNRKQRSKTY